MVELPVLVTAQLTFDTRSDMLREGECAIVTEIEQLEENGTWVWIILSLDKPRLIRYTFHSRPARVFKSWLKAFA